MIFIPQWLDILFGHFGIDLALYCQIVISIIVQKWRATFLLVSSLFLDDCRSVQLLARRHILANQFRARVRLLVIVLEHLEGACLLELPGQVG